VFDGHGGAFTSKFAATEFISIFKKSEAWIQQQLTEEFLSAALMDTMLQLDLDLSQVPAMRWMGSDTEDKSGSTAVVAVVTPTHMLVANCGDCRALLIKSTSEGEGHRDREREIWTVYVFFCFFLIASIHHVFIHLESYYTHIYCVQSGWSSVAMSTDHKPNLDQERARIEAAGNTVQMTSMKLFPHCNRCLLYTYTILMYNCMIGGAGGRFLACERQSRCVTCTRRLRL
jgi:hypothetical protein